MSDIRRCWFLQVANISATTISRRLQGVPNDPQSMNDFGPPSVQPKSWGSGRSAGGSPETPNMMKPKSRLIKGTQMKIASTLLLAAALAGCATVATTPGAPAVAVIKGSQLKIWGTAVSEEAGGWLIRGYVDRYSVTRRPLEEHVHYQVVGAGSLPSHCGEASVSEWVKLKRRDTTVLSVRIPSGVVKPGDRVVLNVVQDTPEDRGFGESQAVAQQLCRAVSEATS